jgi:hypothetical protein
MDPATLFEPDGARPGDIAKAIAALGVRLPSDEVAKVAENVALLIQHRGIVRAALKANGSE